MRLTTMIGIAGAIAATALPTMAAAAPVRAAGALPAGAAVQTGAITRAPTRTADQSALVGVPIALIFAIFGTATVIAFLVSRGRSPG